MRFKKKFHKYEKFLLNEKIIIKWKGNFMAKNSFIKIMINKLKYLL